MLHCAAERGHEEVVRILLAAGSDVHAKTVSLSIGGGLGLAGAGPPSPLSVFYMKVLL